MTNLNSNTFKDWMSNQYSHHELADLANYGAANGFNGLIYYSETTELYHQYETEIFSLLKEDSECFGYNSILEFISTFNNLGNVSDPEQFKNSLVWYAAERIAFNLTEGKYIEEVA